MTDAELRKRISAARAAKIGPSIPSDEGKHVSHQHGERQYGVRKPKRVHRVFMPMEKLP